MGYEKIAVAYEDSVAIVTLNDPGVLNALSNRMVQELHAAIGDVLASDARCLLLTGEGRAFCAGANLAAGGGASEDLPPSGHVLETHYHPVMNQLRQMEIPFVTAINGPAVGVGMSFAVMSDYAIASSDAYFLQAFANIGLVPDGGATWILPRIIGFRRAMELSMLAERLPAASALEWGLINRVVEGDALMDEALTVARRLAEGPRSLALIRKLYWESSTNSYAEQFQLEVNMQQQAQQSNDSREGVLAFLEKRKANFTGT